MYDLIIDSREAVIKVRKNLTIKQFFEDLGVKVNVSPLPCGDYFLLAPEKKKCVLIERKTVVDFANAIRTGRLWGQLEPLTLAKSDFEVIMILEGWIKLLEKFTKWKPQAILRIIEAVQTKYNIPIVYTPNFDWTAKYILAKAKALGKPEEKKVYPIRYGKKPLDLQERILYVAEGLVGATLARRLLTHFKTLRNIANASKIQLMSVEGIGTERANQIWLIFNTEYKDANNKK